MFGNDRREMLSLWLTSVFQRPWATVKIGGEREAVCPEFPSEAGEGSIKVTK